MKKIQIVDPEHKYWEEYWKGNGLKDKRFLYDLVASFYRKFLIKPSLNYFVKKYLRKNSKVLHTGCGGGEVDGDIKKFVKITALDYSQNALSMYKRNNGKSSVVILADIKSLPFEKSTFDGIYNLGVIEHFNRRDINKILKEFLRVLKPGGKLIMFWPPEFGISVIFFKTLVYLSKNILGLKKVKFHPLEISRLKSEAHARNIVRSSGFTILEYSFGARDFFTYVVIVARKD